MNNFKQALKKGYMFLILDFICIIAAIIYFI